MRGSKKLLSLMLALVLTVTMLPAISAKASYGPKISKKKVTLYVGGWSRKWNKSSDSFILL